MNIIIGFKVIPFEQARLLVMNKVECKQVFGLTNSEYKVLFDTILVILSGKQYPIYQVVEQQQSVPTREYRLVNEHRSTRENNTKIASDMISERQFFKTGNETPRVIPMTFDVKFARTNPLLQSN
jgi:hypothetical protein